MRVLGRYVPREAVECTKLGDYRHPYGKDGHQITINHDLNPMAFLVTFVHEAGHLEAWVKYRNKVAPHGKEWQAEYARLLREVIELQAFPLELVQHFLSRGDSLTASSCSDP
eukprot:gene15389-19646_t